jgi:hypothetical protein
MTDMNKINETELTNVAGGNGAPGQCLHLAQPCVQSGYLALRSQPCWDDCNEIGQIYPGNRFYVDLNQCASGSGYTYYMANYNGCCGWVNASYVTLLD